MVNETSEAADAIGVPASEEGSKRARIQSTIQFPYNDLEDAVEVARAIYNNAGQSCDMDQLAAYLRHGTTASGAFRLKVAAARMFGLIDIDRSRVSLSALGAKVVDPRYEQGARSDAFLNVPLYRRIFDTYRGRNLPPNVALENDIVAWGVSTKQREKARQVFQRSAEQAGYFGQGRERLVAPVIASVGGEAATTPVAQDRAVDVRSATAIGFSGSGGQPPGLHPFIQGLLQTLPPTGMTWSESKRREWLQAAETVFKLIYVDESDS